MSQKNQGAALKLSGKRLLLSGDFYLIPKRHLKKHLRALGAILAPSPRRAPRIDAVIAGSNPNEAHLLPLRRQGVPIWDEVSLAEAMGLVDGHGERMARLRGLCYAPSADAYTWRALCEVLEFWPPGEGLSQGLEYVRAFLDRWSVSDSRVPWRWYDRAANGTFEPRLRLVRYADMGLQMRWRPRHLPHVFAQLPPGVTALRVWAPYLSHGALLAHAASLPALRHLSLPWAHLHEGRRQDELPLLSSPLLARLEGLDLRQCRLRPGELERLRAAGVGLRALLHDAPSGWSGLLDAGRRAQWLRDNDYVC
jgi:hypothetical protein